MQITGTQGLKIVALVVGLFVGLLLCLGMVMVIGIGPAQERAGMMVMVVLSMVGAALVFGRPGIAAALFGSAAALGVLIGSTSDVFTRLDTWGFLLLVPTGLAYWASRVES